MVKDAQNIPNLAIATRMKLQKRASHGVDRKITTQSSIVVIAAEKAKIIQNSMKRQIKNITAARTRKNIHLHNDWCRIANKRRTRLPVIAMSKTVTPTAIG
jgi:hypothetical protein